MGANSVCVACYLSAFFVCVFVACQGLEVTLNNIITLKCHLLVFTSVCVVNVFIFLGELKVILIALSSACYRCVV